MNADYMDLEWIFNFDADKLYPLFERLVELGYSLNPILNLKGILLIFLIYFIKFATVIILRTASWLLRKGKLDKGSDIAVYNK